MNPRPPENRKTKGDIRAESHLTRAPRMEGVVKEAMMKSPKKPKQ